MGRGRYGERRTVGVVGVGREQPGCGREEKLIGCVVGVGGRESGDSLTRSPACDVIRPCRENSRRSRFLRELISHIVGEGGGCGEGSFCVWFPDGVVIDEEALDLRARACGVTPLRQLLNGVALFIHERYLFEFAYLLKLSSMNQVFESLLYCLSN